MEKKQKEHGNHRLGYFSENLAVPEIHVDTGEEISDADSSENMGTEEIVYENLAVPEIKIKKKKNM